MKLENYNHKMNELAFLIFSILIVLFPIGLTIWLTQFIINMYIILFIILELILLFMLILNYFSIQSKKNINRKQIKDIGEKIEANIVNVGSYRQKSFGSYYDIYYIDICYDNNKIRIRDIKNNKAYRILKVLLDPYPVKKIVTIPIDTYLYKNKVYADLESVDLTKCQDYEKIEKMME